MRRAAAIVFASTSALVLAALVAARTQATTVDRDLIYLRQGGVAFTMDAFRPAKPNGKAVIFVVSGGWVSDHGGINADLARPFTDNGITLFEVVHGAQPRYKIPEIEAQIARAVRYVRANATKYGIAKDKVGIFGMSAGGHLSLMSAVVGADGKADAADPVERESSKPNAIVAFFPPTDMVNFGTPGRMPFKEPSYLVFQGAFPVKPDDSVESVAKVAKSLSPIYGVTKDFPPTLLIHGDKDPLVPIQQSQAMDAALGAAGVDHKLIVVPGGVHGGAPFIPKFADVVTWFSEKLK